MFGVLICLWCYSFQRGVGAEPVPAGSWVWGEHGWQYLNQLAMRLEVPLYLCSLLFTVNSLPSCLQADAGGLCWLTAVLTNDTSLRPQKHSVTNFSNIVFSLSNLTFVPFRKPAWKDGSTATCVLAVDNILYIANLGDSRVSSMEKPIAGISIPSTCLYLPWRVRCFCGMSQMPWAPKLFLQSILFWVGTGYFYVVSHNCVWQISLGGAKNLTLSRIEQNISAGGDLSSSSNQTAWSIQG